MNKAQNIRLSILETTDVHGSFFPYDLVNQRTPEGSLMQVYTYVQKLRKADSSQVILLDNGDILQGSPVVFYANFISKDKVHLLAQLMNDLGYDAQTIGNHDIEAGHPVYDHYRSGLNFPLLAANAISPSSGESYFQAYHIIHRKGVKIAVLGLITPAIPQWLPEELWAGMAFDDMIENAAKWVKIIQEKEKPDIMVGLFHAGLDASYAGADPKKSFNENASMLVAQQVPGFDIIFSGHDHQKQIIKIRNRDSAEVLVLNAGAYARQIAKADVQLKWNAHTQSYQKIITGSLVEMNRLTPDSGLLQKYLPWFNDTKQFVEEEITELSTDLHADEALNGPSAFVDMIHQAQLDLSGADVSFAAPFSIYAVLKAGIFTRAQLFQLYRFENYLCTIKLSGKEIDAYLEFSTDLWFDTLKNPDGTWLLKNNDYSEFKNPYYNFDSGAGLRYQINPSAAKGNRVNIISMADGSPLIADKMYRVVLNSYRANGGGGHLLKGVGLSKEELNERIISCDSQDFRNRLGNWLATQKRPFTPKSLNLWTMEK